MLGVTYLSEQQLKGFDRYKVSNSLRLSDELLAMYSIYRENLTLNLRIGVKLKHFLDFKFCMAISPCAIVYCNDL